jgi:hypothetical protein
MESKQWYQSRILWLCVADVAASIGDAIINGATWQNITMAAVGAIIAVLRTDTTKQINIATKEASK